jgi:hypothetical protein
MDIMERMTNGRMVLASSFGALDIIALYLCNARNGMD